MRIRDLCPALLVGALAACTSTEPQPDPASVPDAVPAAPAVPAPAVPTTAVPTPSVSAPTPTVRTPAVPAPAPTPEPTLDELLAEPDPLRVVDPGAVPPELPIQPWSSTPHTTSWTLRAEPDQAVVLVGELHAGVLGRKGEAWVQIGADGQLADVAMDRAPKLPIVGVWPSDAWFVDERPMKDDDSGMGLGEIRLMKLRDGRRWVPQVSCGSGGEQWFHPGTSDWYEPHASVRSGMLVYNVESFSDLCRVAGRHDEPDFGRHRGRVVDFLETGKGEIYLLTSDADGMYAVAQCSDDDCVRANTRKLPLQHDWSFRRKVARGKHAVSVIATHGVHANHSRMAKERKEDGEPGPSIEREFVLHYRSKAGWLLDELPAGERPNGMWASEEGGLWTLTGERLRWRDTDSVWHDVALPDGLQTPSVALGEDRKQVWLSGVVDGAPKLFTTEANAPKPTNAGG